MRNKHWLDVKKNLLGINSILWFLLVIFTFIGCISVGRIETTKNNTIYGVRETSEFGIGNHLRGTISIVKEKVDGNIRKIYFKTRHDDIDILPKNYYLYDYVVVNQQQDVEVRIDVKYSDGSIQSYVTNIIIGQGDKGWVNKAEYELSVDDVKKILGSDEIVISEPYGRLYVISEKLKIKLNEFLAEI
jgi:hypothetical protein